MKKFMLNFNICRVKEVFPAAQSAKEPIKKSKLPLMLSAAVVVLSVSVYLFIPEVRDWIQDAIFILSGNDQVAIENWISGFSWFGPFLLILAMVAQMFLVVVPTTLILVVCILAYGPLWGSAIALVAIYTASTAGYFIGRTFGSLTVERILGSKAKTRTTVFLEKYGFWAIFITRLNPLLSNDMVSLIGGMVKMDYWKFTTASIAGIIPLILVIAIFGESPQTLMMLIIVSGITLVVLLGFKVFLKKKLMRSPKRP